jgi:hypothetical protein
VNPIRSRNHRTLAFLALLVSIGAFAAVPGAASADCCLGPGVMVVLKHWTPMRVTFRVSARERAAAARYGARTHHRHGTITFVVYAVDQVTGQPAFARMPYGIDGFVTLPRVR